MGIQVGRVEPPCNKIWLLHDRFHKRNRRFKSANNVFFEGTSHATDGFFPCTASDCQLGQQGVIVGRDGVILIDRSVDAHTDSAGRQIRRHGSCTRQEIVFGVFRIDPTLNGMALQDDVFLLDAEWKACRDLNLIPYDVNRRDLLGHGVLDLESWIHFDKVELTFLVEEKFHGSRVVVAHRAGDGDGGVAHLFTELLRQDQRGSDLDQLLMASLDRAIPFSKMDDIAVAISQNLEFNMMRPLDIFFDKHAAVAKRCLGLACRDFHVFAKLLIGPDHT